MACHGSWRSCCTAPACACWSAVACVKDVDFAMNQITIRDGKGHKDRPTMLPASVKGDLVAHLERVHEQHRAALRHGAGWVELPGALLRKYPNAGRDRG